MIEKYEILLVNDIDEIKRLKASLKPEQFQMLLHDKNSSYSDCAIIHYAVKYNRPKAIETLTGHLNLSERGAAGIPVKLQHKLFEVPRCYH